MVAIKGIVSIVIINPITAKPMHPVAHLIPNGNPYIEHIVATIGSVIPDKKQMQFIAHNGNFILLEIVNPDKII